MQPLVLGAGPAGSVAATLLARAGAKPVLLDRSEHVGDAICGGFLSWRTVENLRKLGCDPESLSARQINRLRLFARDATAQASLPACAFGLSRKSLDRSLRELAIANGAKLEIDQAREVLPGRIVGERREWTSPTIFLASGKHDVRGERRPRQANDPALGLRIRVPPSPTLETRVGDAIELHLFEGGYAGIVLQEDGSANICLALRKSLLAEAGSDPWSLLNNLAAHHPHFAQRLDNASRDLPIDTIGSVPYGWIAHDTQAGLYRLGDQAAVIPSLAGEGMAIAVTSARVAVEAFLSGETAPRYQTGFGVRARRPVAAAKLFWTMSETASGALTMTRLTNYLPGIARLAMRLSRI